MRLRKTFPTFAAGLLTCLCSLSFSSLTAARETPDSSPPTDTNAAPALAAVLEDALKQLKEQQATTFQAIELIRGHTEVALQQNTVAVSNQLAQLGAAIANHSERQFELMRAVEGRTLRVTLAILLMVLLAAGGLLAFVARALRGLGHPHAGPAAAMGVDELPERGAAGGSESADHAAGSAYAAALVEVEKRIAMLEDKHASASRETAATRAAAPTSSASAPAPRLKPAASVALAMGSGEALMFLPRDQVPATNGRAGTALGRISRFFKRS